MPLISELYILKTHSYVINQLFHTPEEASTYATEVLHLTVGNFTVFQFHFTGTYFLKDEEGSSALRCMHEESLRYIGELFLS
jgi:hypothetical protein